MKKTKLLLLTMLTLCAVLAFAACGEEKVAVYEIAGTKDVAISTEVTEYDFLAGISGTKDNAVYAVTVDSSAVVFGTVGEYDVKYTCGTKEVTVKCTVTAPVYEISGAKDVEIRASVGQYDFSADVSGTKDGADCDVSVDTSAVVFGTAGSYSVVYTCGTAQKTITCKVYGLPVFTADETEEVVYSDAEEYVPTANVSAVDSFGTALTVSTLSEFEKDAYNRIKYGNYTFTFVATDKVGNEKSFEKTVSVVGQPSLSNPSDTDLAAPEAVVAIGEKTVSAIRNGSDAVAAENYSVSEGNLALDAAYLGGLGVGTFSFDVDFGTDGYSAFTVTVNDALVPQYDISCALKGEYVEGAQIIFPTADKKEGSYQNITVAYLLDDEVVSQEIAVGTHEFKIVYLRGGEEIKTESLTFKVMAESDFYARKVSGVEFEDLFVPINPSINSVEWVEAEGAYHLINNATDESNDRGFMIDAAYLQKVADVTGAISVSFKFKSDAVSEGGLVFVDYYSASGWNWQTPFGRYSESESYRQITLSFSDFALDEGVKKAPFILDTFVPANGFYIKDVEFIVPVTNPGNGYASMILTANSELNSVEWNTDESCFLLSNNVTNEDNTRFFFINPDYIAAMKAADRCKLSFNVKSVTDGSSLFITKYTVEAPWTKQLYQNPSFWDNTCTIDITNYADGETIGFLSTNASMYLKNLKFEQIVYHAQIDFVATEVEAKSGMISDYGANQFETYDNCTVLSYSNAGGGWQGGKVSLLSSVSDCTSNMIITIRLFVEGSGNVTLCLFSYSETSTSYDNSRTDITVASGAWTEINLNATKFIDVDGIFAGFQWTNTSNGNTVHFDSINIK